MDKRKTMALAGVFIAVILGLVWVNSQKPKSPMLPVKTRIFAPEIKQSKFSLSLLTLGGLGRVYGARGGELHRIEDQGEHTRRVHTFPNRLSAIHEREDGLLIVATDDDHWDPDKPCRIYRSFDSGKTFTLVKTIQSGAVLSWSIASDRAGQLYLAEYGPHQKGMSKTLWRSVDDGDSWKISYQAPDKDKTHLHRIAVDPYTDNLWLTIGDGKNRAMLKSIDHGEHWTQVERLQATAVAFGPQAIFWGRDKKDEPGVLRYDRETQRFENYFDPESKGNYGGSIYDMLRLNSGDLIVPFMKYPNQGHVASVWRGQADNWEQMIQLASEQGVGAGAGTIAGPDKDGWVYFPSYQFQIR